jgi:hypothetical protein
MSIDRNHESFCSITRQNDKHHIPEASLGLAEHRKGFDWPQVVPLLALQGSVERKPCKKLLLIDSGASTNFVSGDFVARNRLQTRQLKQAFKVRLADGTPLSCNSVLDHATIHLSGPDEYTGSHQLMVLDGLKGHDVVLGRSFLTRAGAIVDHQRDHIEWRTGGESSSSSNWRRKGCDRMSRSALDSLHSRVASSLDTAGSAVHSGIDQPADQSAHELKPIVAPSLATLDPAVTADSTKLEDSVHQVGSTEQRRRLEAVIESYKARLAPQKGKLPPHRGEYDHGIQLKDPASKPVKLPAIRQRPALARAMKEKIDQYLAEGKIRRSTSKYGAPAFMIEQGGKQRMVINYVKLNEQTEVNATTLPHVDELIARLPKAKVFSKMDLESGFHQMRMKSDADILMTGFTTPFGHFEWVVAPFGEKNSPASFVQLLTQLVLADLVHDFIIVFVDDILIFSDNEEQHIQHVKAVLDRLADHQLFINPSKCTWMVDEVDFLGYRLRASDEAVEVMIQDNKIKAVMDWPAPKTISQLRSFLGTANFSRPFIKNFSTIAAPLTTATAGKFKSKNSEINWGVKEQQSFEVMKKALTSAPSLAVPDEERPFTLFTDASDFGIGATLCQLNSKKGSLQVCGYMSAKLSGAELNWTTHEKEMFALVRALEHWSMHFVQVQHPITVFTDNIAMLYMLKGDPHQHINGRMARWMNVLMRFKLNPQRIEGTKNVQADALSRRPDLDGGRQEVQAIRRALADKALQHLGLTSMPPADVASTATLASLTGSDQSEARASSTDLVEGIKKGYLHDAYCSRMLNDPARFHVKVEDGLLVNEHGRVIVPSVPHVRSAILVECHDTLTSGHLGVMKTVMRVRESFDWVGVVADVYEFVKSCAKCQANKARNRKEAGFLLPIAPPMNKGLMISIDFVGELPRTARGKDYIMVITDRFSKRVWYEATRKTITAKQAAKIIFERVVRHQGLPDVIISDRDPRFKARVWKALWQHCGTKLAMTVAFRAQANGGTETHNRVMQDMLRAFVNETRSDWDIKLPALEIAYNSSHNETTGYAPFQLDIGMIPRLPIDVASRVGTPARPLLNEFVMDWEESWASAHKNIRDAQARQKRTADRNRRDEQYVVGDMAWIRRDRGTLHGGISAIQKLGPRMEGPYRVTELHGDHNVTLALSEGDGRHTRFHVSQLRPHVTRDEERFPFVRDLIEEPDIDESKDETDSIVTATQVSAPVVISTRIARHRKQVDHGVFLRH